MTPYQRIQASITEAAVASGQPVPVLVAVSKTKPLEDVLEVYEQGQRIFGENYVQELITKSESLRGRAVPGLEFHFIGHLQRNKVKALLPHVTLIHSVDSIRLLEEIDKQARAQDWKGGVLIQVNLDGEASKGGFTAGEVAEVAAWVGRHSPFVRLEGLMCIPDPDKDPVAAFTRLRQLRDQYGAQLGRGLSMGMSSDFPQAIAQGSTYVRVGSAIFGARERKPAT